MNATGTATRLRHTGSTTTSQPSILKANMMPLTSSDRCCGDIERCSDSMLAGHSIIILGGLFTVRVSTLRILLWLCVLLLTSAVIAVAAIILFPYVSNRDCEPFDDVEWKPIASRSGFSPEHRRIAGNAELLVGMNLIDDSSRPIIGVVVTEEHNEVLFPWFVAAMHDKGLHRKGVTVVHIDSHADLMISEDGFFVSAWPRDAYEWSMSLDIASFIFPAIGTGLIDHYVWIRSTFQHTPFNKIAYNWPQWGSHSVMFGHNFLHPNLKPCIWNSTKVATPIDKMLPKHLADMSTDPFYGMESPAFDECTQEPEDGRSARLTTMDLPTALHVSPLCTDPRRCILDIDLDFFSSCDPCISHLEKTGFSHDEIVWLMRFLQSFADDGLTPKCVDRCLHRDTCEEYIDVLKRVLSRTITTSTLTKHVPVISFQEERSLNRLFCRREFQIIDKLKSIRTFMKTHTPQQGGELSNLIHLCMHNFTMELNGPHHLSSDKELRFHATRLAQLIRTSKVKPGLVTITRSVGSGYTPSEIWNKIEHMVFAVLHETLGGKYTIEYLRNAPPSPRPDNCDNADPNLPCYTIGTRDDVSID